MIYDYKPIPRLVTLAESIIDEAKERIDDSVWQVFSIMAQVALKDDLCKCESDLVSECSCVSLGEEWARRDIVAYLDRLHHEYRKHDHSSYHEGMADAYQRAARDVENLRYRA